MGKYTKEKIFKDLAEKGLVWQSPVDNFNNKINMDLKCDVCGGVFNRSVYNWYVKNRRDCPVCKGRKVPTLDRDTLIRLFNENRSDGEEYEFLDSYEIRDGRRCYLFKHLKCGCEFYGSKEFFNGQYGCPECRRIYNESVNEVRRLKQEKLSFKREQSKLRLENKAKMLGVDIVEVTSGRYGRVKYKCVHDNIQDVYISDFYSDKLRFCCSEAYFTNKSKGELELKEYLESFGLKVKSSVRSLISGEIDLWLPDYKVGIEFDGLCCHCEKSLIGNGRNRNYHLDKTIRVEGLGYRLFHIFDCEWYGSKDVVKSMLAHKLGLSVNKVYARNLDVVVLDSNSAFNFYEKTHCQGGIYGKYNYGLSDKGKLMACMSFSNHPVYKYELVRYSTLPYYSVVGGFSKLFKAFVKEYDVKCLMSFVNRRYSSLVDNAYLRNGFELERTTRPNYWYTKGYNKIEARHQFRKSQLDKILGDKFDPLKTEWENLSSCGWDRIWDCGSGVYVWRCGI